MISMIKQLLSIIILVALLPSAYAAKPMSNDEIKKMIVQGSLRDYDTRESRECPRDFQYQPDFHIESKPEMREGSISKQITKEYQYGYGSHFKATESVTQSKAQTNKATDIPSNTPLCFCPCPFSRDQYGKECGEYSAYFQFPDEDKPKCYPEDVKDYEVNDFRSDNGIPQEVEKAAAEHR